MGVRVHNRERPVGVGGRGRLAAGLVSALVLAWGLAGAQLHHQLAEHRHTPVLWQPKSLKLKSAKSKRQAPSHSHGAPARPDHDHGGQSLEHGNVLFHASPALPELRLVVAELALVAAATPPAPYRRAWYRSEQPQGP